MQNKVVIFDFFGVLSSEVAPFWLERFFTEEEAVKVKADIVGDADVGKISCQEMYQKLGEVTGEDPTQIEQDWYALAQIDQAAIAWAEELKNKTRICLLSNAPAEFIRNLLEKHNLGSLFEVIIVSGEEGTAKPAPAIYETILQAMGIDAAEAIFVDDNIKNVKGAHAVGIEAFLFESLEQARVEMQRFVA